MLPSVICSICRLHEHKYKCPACLIVSCSADCTKQHKLQSGCTGKRKRSAFVARSKFDDTTINNDYNFLTDLERGLDNAARHSSSIQHGRPKGQVNSFVKRAMDIGGITVLAAPRGLTRAKLNKSHYINKNACILWTVEFYLEDMQRIVDRVQDTSTLYEAVRPLLKFKETLQDRDPVSLTYLTKNMAASGDQVIYTKLDGTKTLRELLRFTTVVEFPTIWIYRNVPKNMQTERRHAYEDLKALRQADTSTGNDFIPFALSDSSSYESTSDSDSDSSDSSSTNDEQEVEEEPVKKKVSLFGLDT